MTIYIYYGGLIRGVLISFFHLEGEGAYERGGYLRGG